MLETLKSFKLFSLFSYGSTVTLISVSLYGVMKKGCEVLFFVFLGDKDVLFWGF